jgi:hypothetical protein
VSLAGLSLGDVARATSMCDFLAGELIAKVEASSGLGFTIRVAGAEPVSSSLV